MANQDIVVVEDSPNDNGYLKKSAERLSGSNPLRVTGKQDMVDKILARLKPEDCIKNLTIVGHGCTGQIAVGCGMGVESCKYIDGNREEWEPILRALQGRFCDGAKISLFGCNIGAREAGADKLHTLAVFFGVTVEAPTGLVYGDGSREKGSQTQTATPERRPTAIPTPSDKKKGR
jgi:hypothetical protein